MKSLRNLCAFVLGSATQNEVARACAAHRFCDADFNNDGQLSRDEARLLPICDTGRDSTSCMLLCPAQEFGKLGKLLNKGSSAERYSAGDSATTICKIRQCCD